MLFSPTANGLANAGWVYFTSSSASPEFQAFFCFGVFYIDSFALAVSILIITPGPAVLTMAGVGSTSDLRHGMLFLSGSFAVASGGMIVSHLDLPAQTHKIIDLFIAGCLLTAVGLSVWSLF